MMPRISLVLPEPPPLGTFPGGSYAPPPVAARRTLVAARISRACLIVLGHCTHVAQPHLIQTPRRLQVVRESLDTHGHRRSTLTFDRLGFSRVPGKPPRHHDGAALPPLSRSDSQCPTRRCATQTRLEIVDSPWTLTLNRPWTLAGAEVSPVAPHAVRIDGALLSGVARRLGGAVHRPAEKRRKAPPADDEPHAAGSEPHAKAVDATGGQPAAQRAAGRRRRAARR
jgi:hypothetical protein